MSIDILFSILQIIKEVKISLSNINNDHKKQTLC
jgi:hypothetical protein